MTIIHKDSDRLRITSSVTTCAAAARPTGKSQNHAPHRHLRSRLKRVPQKSPQPGVSQVVCARKTDRKSLKRIGSSGRARTYNPSVNSRWRSLGHHSRLRVTLW